MTQQSEERMLDLVECLNSEEVDISIHGGDVIDAGSAFNPPRDEYDKQLAFKARFLKSLNHTFTPMAGNHENPTARYKAVSEMEEWSKRSANPQIPGQKRFSIDRTLSHDPNQLGNLRWEQHLWPGRKTGPMAGETPEGCGIEEAEGFALFHVSPLRYVNRSEFEVMVNSFDCIRGMFSAMSIGPFFSPLGRFQF